MRGAEPGPHEPLVDPKILSWTSGPALRSPHAPFSCWASSSYFYSLDTQMRCFLPKFCPFNPEFAPVSRGPNPAIPDPIHPLTAQKTHQIFPPSPHSWAEVVLVAPSPAVPSCPQGCAGVLGGVQGGLCSGVTLPLPPELHQDLSASLLLAGHHG